MYKLPFLVRSIATIATFFLFINVEISSSIPDETLVVEKISYQNSNFSWTCGKGSADPLCIRKVRQHVDSCRIYTQRPEMYKQIYWLKLEGVLFPNHAEITDLKHSLTLCQLKVRGEIKVIDTSRQKDNLLYISLLFFVFILLPFFFYKK